VKFPGLVFEVAPEPREVRCADCGVLVEGASLRAAYVKCEACRQTDDREKVACAICGEEYRRLGPHLKVHNMTQDEYQEAYPDALLEVPGTRRRSEECRKKQSRAAKRRWQDQGERKTQSERLRESAPWKGKSLSEEHKTAISKGGLGVYHDMSPENRRKTGERGRQALEEIRDDPEVRRKMGEAQKRRHKREPFGLADPEVLAKALKTLRENGVPYGAGRGICGFRRDLDHYTRSTLEANFARILIAAGVKYDYEPKCFKLVLEDGTETYYTPDFFLRGSLLGPSGKPLVEAGWLELKGWRYQDGRLPGDTEARAEALRRVVEEPVRILVGSDYDWDYLKDQWSAKIPMWETSGRNLRTHPEVFGLGGRGVGSLSLR
jgi:hypothetical protein